MKSHCPADKLASGNKEILENADVVVVGVVVFFLQRKPSSVVAIVRVTKPENFHFFAKMGKSEKPFSSMAGKFEALSVRARHCCFKEQASSDRALLHC